MSVLVLRFVNIKHSCHSFPLMLFPIASKPPLIISVNKLVWICLSVFSSFFSVSKDATLPRSSWYLASLSLSGCCFLSLLSWWLPTAYGENWGKGKRQRKKICSWKKKWKGNQEPKTTMTLILQLCTTLFFCLDTSWLINSRYALCYPHRFFFIVRQFRHKAMLMICFACTAKSYPAH